MKRQSTTGLTVLAMLLAYSAAPSLYAAQGVSKQGVEQLSESGSNEAEDVKASAIEEALVQGDASKIAALLHQDTCAWELKCLLKNKDYDDKSDVIANVVFQAAISNYSDVIQKLEGVGINTAVKNRFGQTAADLMKQRNDKDGFLFLVEQVGFEIDDDNVSFEIDDDDRKARAAWTPLYDAARLGKIEKVRSLLDGDAVDVNESKNIYQRTALHAAARVGHIDVVRILAKQADVNKKDLYGWTALAYAQEEGHDEIAEFLRDAIRKLTVRPTMPDRAPPCRPATPCQIISQNGRG